MGGTFNWASVRFIARDVLLTYPDLSKALLAPTNRKSCDVAEVVIFHKTI
jgi:hypothetical protein